MKYLSVSACFIVLSSCAAKNNTASFLQHESKSTDIKAEYTETENNIEKYKYQLEDKLFLITKNIMEDEKEITKALSYKRMVRFIGYIKKELEGRYHVKGFLEGRVGCAIGAHTGPGILGIVFLNETNEKYEEYLK